MDQCCQRPSATRTCPAPTGHDRMYSSSRRPGEDSAVATLRPSTMWCGYYHQVMLPNVCGGHGANDDRPG
jgi:hypothetical protein